MADSIGKVGSVARTAGVDLDELAGFTTAIVSATGISGSEAGTALKSIIARTFRIGEEGMEDAGKTEEVLAEIGISVRKSATEFRDLGDILKDLQGKWTSLTNIEKQNISQTIAGIEKRSNI